MYFMLRNITIQLNALLEFQVEGTGAIGRGEERRGMTRHQDARPCNEETHIPQTL